MKKISNLELSNIKGGAGTTLTSSFVNAFTNIIKVLFDAGHSVGSAIRRISEGNLCSID